MWMNVNEKRIVQKTQYVKILLDHFSVFVKLDTVAMENTVRVRQSILAGSNFRLPDHLHLCPSPACPLKILFFFTLLRLFK